MTRQIWHETSNLSAKYVVYMRCRSSESEAEHEFQEKERYKPYVIWNVRKRSPTTISLITKWSVEENNESPSYSSALLHWRLLRVSVRSMRIAIPTTHPGWIEGTMFFFAILRFLDPRTRTFNRQSSSVNDWHVILEKVCREAMLRMSISRITGMNSRRVVRLLVASSVSGMSDDQICVFCTRVCADYSHASKRSDDRRERITWVSLARMFS